MAKYITIVNSKGKKRKLKIGFHWLAIFLGPFLYLPLFTKDWFIWSVVQFFVLFIFAFFQVLSEEYLAIKGLLSTFGVLILFGFLIWFGAHRHKMMIAYYKSRGWRMIKEKAELEGH